METLGIGQVAAGTPRNLSRTIELEALLKKYSERHPDVIRLKRGDRSNARGDTGSATATNIAGSVTRNSLYAEDDVGEPIGDLKTETNALKAKTEELRPQISLLQSRVDNTPLRAIEISKITRNYDITLRKYQDLLAKSLDSELSENMERKQKGEQFQIVDRANIPQHPVAPNRQRILLIGLFLGIGGGIGLAFLLDNLDKSFKSNEDLVGYSNVRLLAVLPTVATRGSVLEHRQARAMVIVASFGALVVGLVLVRYLGALLLFR